jgi:hypothetical protein
VNVKIWFTLVADATTGEPIAAVVGFLAAALAIAVLWAAFVKADDHGWASVVPIYNLVVLLRIAEMPVFCLLLFFVPLVNVIVVVVVVVRLARAFGKGFLFALGLLFLPSSFIPCSASVLRSIGGSRECDAAAVSLGRRLGPVDAIQGHHPPRQLPRLFAKANCRVGVG